MNRKPCCINLYDESGKERKFQDRIYMAEISPALTSSFRPFYIEGGRMNSNCKLLGLLNEDGFEIENRVYGDDGSSPTLRAKTQSPKILIRQGTKKGYTELTPGGVCDLSYPTSSTRRGRVQKGGEVAPTLTAENCNVYKIDNYRIRKLTPRECYRLMGFSDDAFDRASRVCSNTQLYKQAGNSIVVNVLEDIFAQLF